jgi:hypothetical protein
MKSVTLPQVIPTLSKFYHKIISIETIKSHIQKMTIDQLKHSQIYKIMYHLRAKWYIISCKKDLFYIKPPHISITDEEIAGQWYRKLLNQHCRKDCTTIRYIWGISALELINGLSQINTDELIIINWHKTAKEVICFDKKIIYKSYRDNHGEALIRQTKKYTNIISLPWVKIKHAVLELALLETLYSPPRGQQAYIQEFVRKLLKKHKKTLNWSVLESMIKLGKFHSSFNRLYKISKEVDSTMTQQLQDLIKKYSYIMEV